MVKRPGVRSMPTLPLRALWSTGTGQLPPPLHQRGATFWFSARVALCQAIAVLGLGAGDAIALPAFCCGSEIDPFTLAGVTPRFFGVTDTLDPDPESFAAALEGSAAALATHYFGFPAHLDTMRRACRTASVPLIEDCAHALYAKDANGWLGAQADVAVFSLAKTLPIPDGGALITRVHDNASAPEGSPPPGHVITQRTRSLVIRHLQAHSHRPVSWLAHLPSTTRHYLRLPRSEPDRNTEAGLLEYMRFDPSLVDARMSARSRQLVMQTAHGDVRDARRRNYARLLDVVRHCAGLRPLLPSLPDGACPLALPVVVSDPEAFRRRLASDSGIGVRQMWPLLHASVPWKDFPFEAHLKRSVFILPVHQSLEEREIDRIITTVARWTGQ